MLGRFIGGRKGGFYHEKARTQKEGLVDPGARNLGCAGRKRVGGGGPGVIRSSGKGGLGFVS